MGRKRLEPVTRREVLAAGAGLGALALGCGGPGDSDTPDQGIDGGIVDALVGSSPDAGLGGNPDGGAQALPDLGLPETASRLWQTMAPYVRATDGAIGSRVNLFNPAPVEQRLLIQVMLPDGQLVLKDEQPVLPPLHARHLELDEYLTEHGIPLPFEGSLWVGTTPESGRTFMGLQGITFDWYGPAYMASVHGMRDFGNSNHDGVWADLILPGVTVGPRFVTHVAILNASGDGVSEALNAQPELLLRGPEGDELGRSTLDALGPYQSTLVDVRDLIGGEAFAGGTAQLTDPHVGLVAMGLVFDTENEGIVTADHFFDRHFVVSSTGFDG